MQIILLILAAIISVGTIVYGIKVIKKPKKTSSKRVILTTLGAFGLVMVGAIIATLFGGNIIAEAAPVAAEIGAAAATVAETSTSIGDGIKYLAAALATGIATIATGIAVGSVGSAAIGAISEDQSLLGKTLIFVGMAEGISIYGLIISILILFV